MRLSWAHITSVLVFFALLSRVTFLVAQVAEPEPMRADQEAAAKEVEADESSGVPIREAKPSIHYVPDPDQNGKLVPVINITLEELEELLNLRHRNDSRNDLPPYVIHEVTIDGTATDETADVTATIKVSVNTSGWVRVPLRLDEAILREQAKHEGPGEYLPSLEDQTAGHVAWLNGQGSDKHEISMRLLVPLTRVGAQRRLKLQVPPAPTSRLSLTVTGRDFEARVHEPAQVSTRILDSGLSTQFTVLGSGGGYDLTWQPRDQAISDLSPVLEATGGAMDVVIDGEWVTTVAKLNVRSLGAAFETFRVRLPPGAELLERNTPDYEMRLVSDEGAEQEEKTAERFVEIRLAEATEGPVPVTLFTRQRHDQTRTDNFVELAGFEVVGAVRQSGHIAVSVGGDWRLVWGGRRNVHQVPRLPANMERGDLEARFEYVHQPSQRTSLQVRVSPRRSRLRVEPSFQFDVASDRVTMRGVLKYSVRGAMPATLQIELPAVAFRDNDNAPLEPQDWIIDELGPASVVDIDDVVLDELDPLSIPLPQPAPDGVELSIEAHIVLPPGIRQLALPVPRAAADVLSPAAVTIQPADNVEMMVREGETNGLVRQPVEVEPPSGIHQQPPLFYRAEIPQASFAADFQVRRRRVDVDVVSQVEIDQKRGSVSQRFNYVIAYEPLDEVGLDVPAVLETAGPLEVSLDGEDLTGTLVTDEPQGSVTRRLIVRLPTPKIGPCPLTVRFPLAHDPLPSDASVNLEIPLVMPTDGTLASNRVEMVTRTGITARLRDESWSEPREPNDVESRIDRTFVCPERKSILRLSVNLDDAAAVAPMEVQRAWIQSWLVNGQRQDRVLYRIRTDEGRLALTLPDSVDLESVRANVDSDPVVVRPARDGGLVIRLPDASALRDHEVELRYRFRGEPAPRFGSKVLSAPAFANGTSPRRTYWQLILPRNVHLLTGAGDFTFEFDWEREGFYWIRRPVMEQTDLETWAGAASLREQPSRSTNRYLFSTLGPAQQLRVYTAERWLIVLIASGGTLAVGLLLINVSALRHPAVLFALALAVLAGVVIFPASMTMFGQAAGFGAFLSLLAFWLKRAGDRRRRPSVVAGSGSHNAVIELGSSRTKLRPAGAGSEGSTNVSKGSAEMAVPDSKS